MTDLKTDSKFASSYETVYPKESSLSTDIYGNIESNWQCIAVAPIYDFAQSFFYFYHPLCDQPKWTNKITGETSFDINYRISMSVSGDLSSYTHYDLEMVNRSDDLRFFKFKCSTSFTSRLKNADYRAYDISEFEILNHDGLNGSNSYNVGVRFSWTKDSSTGDYVSSKQEIDTIQLEPHFDNFKIYGANGTTTDTFPSVKVYDVASPFDNDSSTQTLTWKTSNWTFEAAFTDSYYVVFPVKKTYGELCGAKFEYNRHDGIYFYKPYLEFGAKFDKDYAKKAYTTSNVANYQFDKLDSSQWTSETDKTLFVSTGLDSNYSGVVQWNDEVVASGDQASNWTNWWLHHTIWDVGYADDYDLKSIQQLKPLSGSDFVKDLSGVGLESSSTNPYAITSDTAAYLTGQYNSGSFVSNDYYILRFDMQNFSLFKAFWGMGRTEQEYGFTYASHYWADTDVDLMELHFFKDGTFYTIGVKADSADVVPNPDVPDKTDSNYTFNWRILLAVCSVIALIALIWFSVVTIGNAVGKGDKDK
jgi:hypothetical protein